MKYLLLTAFLFIGKISLCQISPEELLSLLDRSESDFETFVLENNFEFNEHNKNEKSESYYYTSNNKSKGRADILGFTIYPNKTKTISYAPSNSKDYLNFKKKILEFGFKYLESELLKTLITDNRTSHTYIKDDYSISMTTNIENDIRYFAIIISKYK
jgi:hypothetical protein